MGPRVGNESSIGFTVPAPFYRSPAAYAAYALGTAAVFVLVGWLASAIQRRENLRLEKLVAMRTSELHEANVLLSGQIAESQEKAAQLKLSNDRYQRLSENAPDIIFRVRTRPEPAYDYISPAVIKVMGYSPEEFYKNPELTAKIARPLGASTIMDLARSDTAPPALMESLWCARDGRIVTLEQRLVPVYGTDGRLAAIEGIARDVSDRKSAAERQRRLETELFQAQKLESIGTLAGGIAHDFNNILTGILGYCELAVLAGDQREAVEENLREIRAGGLRAKDLVQQILTFSRRSAVRLTPIDLAEVVGEALKFVRATVPATIVIDRDLQPGVVMADATQVHQIVLNLCTNAIHAMQGRTGRLTVSVARVTVDKALSEELRTVAPGPHVRLGVRDTGSGMDAATLSQIFDPFFTTKKHGEGTGLGLSVVKGIVSNHNAALRVESAVGSGSLFEVYFPPGIAAAVVQESEAQIARGEQRSVLVVDDEDSVAHFVGANLRRFDYKVSVFGDPQAALAAYRTNPSAFDVLVTDLTMPHMTGIDLMRKLRELRPELPVIVMSGYHRDLIEADLQSGTAILAKPFSGADLARALGELLLRARSVPR